MANAATSPTQQLRGGYALAQEVTGLKYTTLTALVSQRRIPHSRISPRMVIFDRAELEAWVRAHAVPEGSPRKPSPRPRPKARTAA